MMDRKKRLTLDDLVTAFIDDGQFAQAHEDIRGYHKKKLELLKKLFRCDLNKRQKALDDKAEKRRREMPDGRPADKYYEISGTDTIHFLDSCIGAIRKSKSPFPEYLEGMPPKIVRELRKRYGEKISAHEQELNQLNRLLVKEVLKYLFPKIEKKTFPEDKLFKLGLPKEEPDPYDYF